MKRSFALLLLVAACAPLKPTPYGPSQNGGLGYVDRQVAPRKYVIQVRANSATSRATMEQYFNQRASELCGPVGYESLIEHDQQTEIHDGQFTGTVYIPTTTSRIPVVTGNATCKDAPELVAAPAPLSPATPVAVPMQPVLVR